MHNSRVVTFDGVMTCLVQPDLIDRAGDCRNVLGELRFLAEGVAVTLHKEDRRRDSWEVFNS